MAFFADKTVLVTGATGFLGGALARRLAAEGAHVRALTRRPGRDGYLQNVANLEIVSGDITDATRMQAVAEGSDVIFHVAAALNGTLEAQRRVNVDGTRAVIQAARAAGVQRVVHVSSIAVYGYGYRGDVTEAMPLRPGRVPYNVSKAEAEAVVRAEGERLGVGYSIIRPGMIYGPRSGMWTRTMFNLAKRRPTVFVGNGSGHAHAIYVDDVVDLMLLLANHPAAAGEAFNCAPDPAPTWRQFLGGYARLAGHDRWLGLPPLLARVLAFPVEGLLSLRGEPQNLPALVGFMQAKTTYRVDKARRLLGWQPSVSLEEGIQRCAPWLREKDLL